MINDVYNLNLPVPRNELFKNEELDIKELEQLLQKPNVLDSWKR